MIMINYSLVHNISIFLLEFIDHIKNKFNILGYKNLGINIVLDFKNILGIPGSIEIELLDV